MYFKPHRQEKKEWPRLPISRLDPPKRCRILSRNRHSERRRSMLHIAPRLQRIKPSPSSMAGQ
jgi:hypothetical protein